MDKLKGELVDIIEWVNDSRHTLVWRFPRHHNQIKNGAQLIVRPGQVAVFVHEATARHSSSTAPTCRSDTPDRPFSELPGRGRRRGANRSVSPTSPSFATQWWPWTSCRVAIRVVRQPQAAAPAAAAPPTLMWASTVSASAATSASTATPGRRSPFRPDDCLAAPSAQALLFQAPTLS